MSTMKNLIYIIGILIVTECIYSCRITKEHSQHCKTVLKIDPSAEPNEEQLACFYACMLMMQGTMVNKTIDANAIAFCEIHRLPRADPQVITERVHACAITANAERNICLKAIVMISCMKYRKPTTTEQPME